MLSVITDNENTKSNPLHLKNSSGGIDGAGEKEQRWDEVVITAMSSEPIKYRSNILGALYELLHAKPEGQVS